MEVVVDHMVADPIEALRGYFARIERLVRRSPMVGMDIDPIVVGPHEGELDLAVAARFQVAAVEATV